MADEWSTVSKKTREKTFHAFTEDAAHNIGRHFNCQGLALAIRTPAFEAEWAAGWGIATVRKGTDVAIVGKPVLVAEMLIPEPKPDAERELTTTDYEFKLVAVPSNKWNDYLVLRRLKSAVR